MTVDIPSAYMMHRYTVSETSPGKWRWTLLADKKADSMALLVHGVVNGTRAAAEAAAKNAIEKRIGAKKSV